MTRANWPQMEVVTSIEGEGMRWCCRSQAGLWQINGSGFSHQHHSCNICLSVSLWYCMSLSGCSRSLPCSSCSVCMCGFESVKCIYFSNAGYLIQSIHTPLYVWVCRSISLAASSAQSAVFSHSCHRTLQRVQCIFSQLTLSGSEGTRDVSHVSKCQSPRPNGAEQ